VTGSTHLRAGESQLAGEVNDGWDVDQDIQGGSPAEPRLEIDANVDFGQVRVINSNTASVADPGYGSGPLRENGEPLRAAEAKACTG
jgi:hypothetical protein